MKVVFFQSDLLKPVLKPKSWVEGSHSREGEYVSAPLDPYKTFGPDQSKQSLESLIDSELQKAKAFEQRLREVTILYKNIFLVRDLMNLLTILGTLYDVTFGKK